MGVPNSTFVSGSEWYMRYDVIRLQNSVFSQEAIHVVNNVRSMLGTGLSQLVTHWWRSGFFFIPLPAFMLYTS